MHRETVQAQQPSTRGRVLLGPDSFKGSLSAHRLATLAAEALTAEGFEPVSMPLADGGEGSAEALAARLGGRWHEETVLGPIGEPVRARWLMLPDATAVVEVASAIAPTHLAPQRRDPTVTTSYGVGQLMRAALAHRPRRLVLALGGSSTCDGGAGMLQALGATLQGVEAPASGGTLGAARAVEVPHLEVELVALCDVAVPLLGATGAARLFAPQKGATPAQVDLLEAHLTHWARTLGPAWAELPGAGAAGGLGFALAALGARLVSGIDWILDALPFDAELARCDVVLTGEGRVDAQTLQGKVVSGVLRRARALGRPAWLVAGRIDLSPDALRELGVAAAVTLAPEGTPAEQSVSCAQDFVAGAVSRLIERWRGARVRR